MVSQIQHDFEQIIDDRYNRKALILASQLPIKDWYNVFISELIAEACLDRIVHKSKRFELKGESLRKKWRRGNSPWIAPALLTKYLSTTEHEEGQVADSTHLCPQPLYL